MSGKKAATSSSPSASRASSWKDDGRRLHHRCSPRQRGDCRSASLAMSSGAFVECGWRRTVPVDRAHREAPRDSVSVCFSMSPRPCSPAGVAEDFHRAASAGFLTDQGITSAPASTAVPLPRSAAQRSTTRRPATSPAAAAGLLPHPEPTIRRRRTEGRPTAAAAARARTEPVAS